MTKFQLALVIASCSTSTAFHVPRLPSSPVESWRARRDNRASFPTPALSLATAPSGGLAPGAVASTATFDEESPLPSWRRRSIHQLCGRARRAAAALVVPQANSLRASVRRVAISAAVLLAVACPSHNAIASVGMGGASSTAAAMFNGPLWVPAVLWLSMFVFSATLHAAEISITTLYPWKVRDTSA